MRRTEKRNPRSKGIDEKSSQEILRIITAEDRTVPMAVAEAIPEIVEGVEAIAETVRSGGRVFFLGAGTSGRLGVLEAAEIPPTFGVSPDLFRALVSGGRRGVRRERPRRPRFQRERPPRDHLGVGGDPFRPRGYEEGEESGGSDSGHH